MRDLELHDMQPHRAGFVTAGPLLRKLGRVFHHRPSPGPVEELRQRRVGIHSVDVPYRMLCPPGEAAFDRSKDEQHMADTLARHSPPLLAMTDDLQKAMRRFAEVDEGLLAVVDSPKNMRLIGCLHERDVMRAYNTALMNQRAEEHGETL